MPRTDKYYDMVFTNIEEQNKGASLEDIHRLCQEQIINNMKVPERNDEIEIAKAAYIRKFGKWETVKQITVEEVKQKNKELEDENARLKAMLDKAVAVKLESDKEPEVVSVDPIVQEKTEESELIPEMVEDSASKSFFGKRKEKK